MENWIIEQIRHGAAQFDWAMIELYLESKAFVESAH